MKSFFKKGDIVIVICALVISLMLFLPEIFSNDSASVARVYENGVITHEIKLSDVCESYKIEINGAVLLVESTGISYVEADCKDRICVRSGKLTKPGDTAACIPNKTVVTLVKVKDKADIDIITY